MKTQKIEFCTLHRESVAVDYHKWVSVILPPGIVLQVLSVLVAFLPVWADAAGAEVAQTPPPSPFGPAEVTLDGSAAPAASLSVCGFRLVARGYGAPGRGAGADRGPRQLAAERRSGRQHSDPASQGPPHRLGAGDARRRASRPRSACRWTARARRRSLQPGRPIRLEAVGIGRPCQDLAADEGRQPGGPSGDPLVGDPPESRRSHDRRRRDAPRRPIWGSARRPCSRRCGRRSSRRWWNGTGACRTASARRASRRPMRPPSSRRSAAATPCWPTSGPPAPRLPRRGRAVGAVALAVQGALGRRDGRAVGVGIALAAGPRAAPPHRPEQSPGAGRAAGHGQARAGHVQPSTDAVRRRSARRPGGGVFVLERPGQSMQLPPIGRRSLAPGQLRAPGRVLGRHSGSCSPTATRRPRPGIARSTWIGITTCTRSGPMAPACGS